MILLFFESTRAICEPVLVLKATCAFETFLPERGQTDFSSGASLLGESREFPAPLSAGPFVNCTCPGINVPCCGVSSFQVLPIMVTTLLVSFFPVRPPGQMVGHAVLRLAEEQQIRSRAVQQTTASGARAVALAGSSSQRPAVQGTRLCVTATCRTSSALPRARGVSCSHACPTAQGLAREQERAAERQTLAPGATPCFANRVWCVLTRAAEQRPCHSPAVSCGRA